LGVASARERARHKDYLVLCVDLVKVHSGTDSVKKDTESRPDHGASASETLGLRMTLLPRTNIRSAEVQGGPQGKTAQHS
jgi:hypothetical protein